MSFFGRGTRCGPGYYRTTHDLMGAVIPPVGEAKARVTAERQLGCWEWRFPGVLAGFREAASPLRGGVGVIGREKQVLLPQYVDQWGSFPTLALSAAVDGNGGAGPVTGQRLVALGSTAVPRRIFRRWIALPGSRTQMPESMHRWPDSSTGRRVTGWMPMLPGLSGQVMDIYALANLP